MRAICGVALTDLGPSTKPLSHHFVLEATFSFVNQSLSAASLPFLTSMLFKLNKVVVQVECYIDYKFVRVANVVRVSLMVGSVMHVLSLFLLDGMKKKKRDFFNLN